MKPKTKMANFRVNVLRLTATQVHTIQILLYVLVFMTAITTVHTMETQIQTQVPVVVHSSSSSSFMHIPTFQTWINQSHDLQIHVRIPLSLTFRLPVVHSIRGGGGKEEEEESENEENLLDAYVEKLIASVDDDDENEDENEIEIENEDDLKEMKQSNKQNQEDKEENEERKGAFINPSRNSKLSQIPVQVKEQSSINSQSKDKEKDISSKNTSTRTSKRNRKQTQPIGLMHTQLSEEEKDTKSYEKNQKPKKMKHKRKRTRIKHEPIINTANQDKEEKRGGKEEAISSQNTKIEEDASINMISKPEEENNSQQLSSSSSSSPSNQTQQQKQEQQRKEQLQSIKPPNSIQRFLLHKGQIGRSITTLFILLNEFFYYYLPDLYSILSIILHKLLPKHLLQSYYHYDSTNHHPQQKLHNKMSQKEQSNTFIPKVHSQYDAFISNQSLGGKKITKEQKKQLDQIALDKLKQVSKKQQQIIGIGGMNHDDVNTAMGGVSSNSSSGVVVGGEYKEGGIYTHLSLRFMKRYNLGHYAQEKKMFDSMIGVLGDDYDDKNSEINVDGNNLNDDDDEKKMNMDTIHFKNNDLQTYIIHGDNAHYNDDDDDDDDDWVAKAFLINDNLMDEEIVIDDFYGDYEKDREARKNIDILEAAYASKEEIQSKKKKQTKVKSDKDGGSGMFGRLRAVGTKNSVSSRIFGAYPGDAVSIEEAANANGVIRLAERYGYGDWSDGEGDNDDDEIRKRSIYKKKRKQPRRKKSGESRHRRRSIFDSGDGRESGVSVSFNLGDTNGISLNFGTSSSSSSKAKRRIKSTKMSPGRDRKKPQRIENLEVTERPIPPTMKNDKESKKVSDQSTSVHVKHPILHTKSRHNISDAQRNILNHQLNQRAKKKSDESNKY